MLVKPDTDTRNAETYRQQHKDFCQPFRKYGVTSP